MPSPEDIALIASRYRDGESLYSLSNESGISRRRLATLLEKAGIKLRGRSAAWRAQWKLRPEQVKKKLVKAWEARRGNTDSEERIEKRRVARRKQLVRIRQRIIEELHESPDFREGKLSVFVDYPYGNCAADILLSPGCLAVEIATLRGADASEARVSGLIRRGLTVAVVSLAPARKRMQVSKIVYSLVTLHRGCCAGSIEATTVVRVDSKGQIQFR